MISLDKNILNKDSSAARRMIEYGKENKLVIIIPASSKLVINLSDPVQVQTSGGRNKVSQFFSLLKLASQVIKQSDSSTTEKWVTTQDPFFTGLIGWYLKKKFGIKLEIQVHGDFFGSQYYKNQLLKLWLGRVVLRRADKIRTVGERVSRSLINLGVRKNFINIRPISLEVQPQGRKALPPTPVVRCHIDKENTLFKDFPGYGKYFVWGGRMEPVKNLLWLVDIFSEVVKKKRNYLLLLIGAGSEKVKLLKEVKNLKLENNVRFIPWVDSLIPYIINADCVLFPSLSEGCGLVAVEAVAAGTPVIMNDVGVANYELQSSEKIKIISVSDRQKWLVEILKI